MSIKVNKFLMKNLSRQTFSHKLEGPIEQIVTGYDGILLYSFCNNNINIWNIDSFTHVFDFEAHKENITKILYLREYKLLASVSKDKTLSIWDPLNEEERLKKSLTDHKNSIKHLDTCVLNNNQVLFTICDKGELCFWSLDNDVSKITLLNKNMLEDIPITVAYCQDKKHLILVVEHGFYVYEHENKSVSDLFTVEENEIRICKYFGDGTTVLCYSKNNNIDFWECD